MGKIWDNFAAGWQLLQIATEERGAEIILATFGISVALHVTAYYWDGSIISFWMLPCSAILAIFIWAFNIIELAKIKIDLEESLNNEILPYRWVKRSKACKKKLRMRIYRRDIFLSAVFFVIFIISWMVLFALVQLYMIPLKFLGNIEDWKILFTVNIFLALFLIFALQVFRCIFYSFNYWLYKMEVELRYFIMQARRKYLSPKKIIPFVFYMTAIFLAILLFSYWVEHSKIPRIKESGCEAYDNCNNETDISAVFPWRGVSGGYNEERLESETNILRNKWLWIFAFLGIGLTVWGRIISHREHLQTQKQIEQTDESLKISRDTVINERFMKAVDMLGSESLSIRVNGCSSLMWIANDYKNMKEQCLRMLFTFINNPYLDADEKKLKKQLEMNGLTDEDVFKKMFPADKILRTDIQEAANGFSDIYKKYEGVRMERIPVKLREYFWKNKEKGLLCLIGANLTKHDFNNVLWLHGASLQKIDFSNSHLIGANFRQANLQNANFISASFEGGVLDSAIMNRAKLRSVEMKDVSLLSTELNGANFNYANLQNCSLGDAKFKGAGLMRSSLENCKLQSANFVGARLYEARLRECDLQFADFGGAFLRKANLNHNYFRNVNFVGADLGGANIQEADLANADFKDAENLTKEQILSAKWIKYNESDAAPELPDYLLDDEDIQEWINNPTHTDE